MQQEKFAMCVLLDVSPIPTSCIFHRQPKVYEVLTLPSKLPPLKQPLPITSLPMLGYMEQAVATAIIEVLSTIGSSKPKFPFYSSTKSALYYVGLYLKGMLISLMSILLLLCHI